MKSCATCGSSARLRFDHEQRVFVCVTACATAQPRIPARRAGHRPRQALFNAWWTNPETNERTRATRDELRTANYLWFKHRDIREGRVDA